MCSDQTFVIGYFDPIVNEEWHGTVHGRKYPYCVALLHSASLFYVFYFWENYVSIEVLSREIRISFLIRWLHNGASRHKFLDILYISVYVVCNNVTDCKCNTCVCILYIYIYGNNLYVYFLVHGQWTVWNLWILFSYVMPLFLLPFLTV